MTIATMGRPLSARVSGAGFKGVFVGTQAERNAAAAQIAKRGRRPMRGAGRGGYAAAFAGRSFGGARVLNHNLPPGTRFAGPASSITRDF